MDELFQQLDKNDQVTDSEISNAIRKEHHILGLMPSTEIPVRLQRIYQILNSKKHGKSRDRLQFYILIFSIILFQKTTDLLNFSYLSDGKLVNVFITYALRRQMKLPLDVISQVYEKGIQKLSLTKSFYEFQPIYFYQRVPELMKCAIKATDNKQFIQSFFDTFFSIHNLDNVNHSTILFFSCMIQQILTYLMSDNNEEIIDKCNLFFTKIFSIQLISPSVILLHFLHYWYILDRFCIDRHIQNSSEPQTHLISDLFKKVSVSKKHELYRLFHWNLVVVLRLKYQNTIWQLNSLCLILIFFKTIYHIESMRDMIEPSQNFLNQLVEQSKSKTRFSFCTVLSFFDSCLKEYINSISEFFLIVINSNLNSNSEENKVKPIKITFSEQLECSQNEKVTNNKFDLLDDYLYTIMNEKTIEISDFSIQFESLITRCDLMKTRIATARFFLFPCYKKALTNIEFLPYSIQITKTLFKVVLHINQAIFSIQYIKITPSRNPELENVIDSISEVLKEIPEKVIPYLTSAIAKLLFKQCKKFKITRLTIDFLCSLPNLLFISIIKDMIQYTLTKKELFFAHDYETTFSICRFVIFTYRLFSIGDQPELNKELIPIFNKCILKTIFSNIKKISNQRVVFQMMNLIIKSNKPGPLNIPIKISYFEDIMDSAKKDFIFSFISLIPKNNDPKKSYIYNSIYEYALKYGDSDSIHLASKYCQEVFPISNRQIFNDHHYISLYQAWKNANLNKEDRSIMISTIPYYIDAYLLNENKPVHDTLLFEEVYNCISNSMNNDPDSILISFSVYKNGILNAELTIKEANSLNEIFLRCLSFQFMKEKIDQFVPKMIKFHANLFLEGKSNAFFLSLLETSSGIYSYLGNEIHDIEMKFIELVVNKDPQCPMIQTTIDQILIFIPKKIRIYSILTATSIFLKYCPTFVTNELIRNLIIASNDAFFFDYTFAQSFSRVLENYASIIDEETTKEFCEMIYHLFNTTIITFKLPLLKIIKKINPPPPNYQFFKDSQFKGLELQKVMISLLFDESITPFIIEFTKKHIFEKNETMSHNDRLSRKFSLIYSTISNEHNFSIFTEDQSFTVKLTNFISSSIAQSLKIISKDSKEFFLSFLSMAEKDKKLDFIIHQFSRPIDSKTFSLFDDRVEKIMCFKRLLKLRPELIQINLILDIIILIGEYLQKTDEQKGRYFPNLKIFLDFLGSKQATSIFGLGEVILSNAISHYTYLTYYIESYHNLLLSNQYLYRTVLLKSFFKFVINFPEDTIKYMIDSNQGPQMYTSFIPLLDFEEFAGPFYSSFIDLCKSKKDPFCYPLHFYEIIEKMSSIKSCATNYDFLELIDFIFNQIVTRFNNITNNLYFVLFRMITALTNTFKFVEDINRFIVLLSSFDLPLILNSISYHNIIKKCIKRTSEQFKYSLIKFFIDNPYIIKQSTFDNALQHTIKETKKIPRELIDEAWHFLIHTNNVTSILRLLQHEVPSDEILLKISQIAYDSSLDSSAEVVIHSIKLMIELAKIDKLPANIYWLYIKQSLYIFKFMDIPFSKYTFQMLKLMKDHFQEVPDEIADAFAIFIHTKCNSIRDAQRIIEILLCAPPLNKASYFSPLLIISSFLEKKLSEKDKLPPKASYDCILNVGIKYILKNDVDEDEKNHYFRVCYQYIKLIILGMPYYSFLDKLSNYFNDHELPVPPQSIISELSNENNKFSLPSFILFCILLKNNPEEHLQYNFLIEKSFKFIKETNENINPLTLQFFIETVCKSDQYIQLVHSTYSYLMRNGHKTSHQKVFQMIYSIMKANILIDCYEEMWDFLIKMEEKQAYIYLKEEEQIRYTKFMISKSENNELFIIQTANIFLDSKLISKQAKIILLSNLASFVNCLNADLILICIEKIESFGASIKRDFKSEIADILIEAARCSNHLYKLKLIRKLNSLIPKEINEKLNFVFNLLPYQSWRDETLAFVLTTFAIDLKKWFPIFAFGNSFQSIISDLAVYFLREHLNENTIKLFSDFFLKILSINDKSHYNGIINGISYIFFSTEYPIHPKIFLKADQVINHPEYLTHFLDNLSTFSDNVEYFLPHYLNDYLFGQFGHDLDVSERTAISLTLLSKFNTADILYYQNDSAEEGSLFDIFKRINFDENRFWSFISSSTTNSYFNDSVDYINKTSLNLEKGKFQFIEGLLDQAHDQLISEFNKKNPYFKDELFASIETAIQLEKHLIYRKQKQQVQFSNSGKISLDFLTFMQSLNPFLLSMISNFKDEIKGLLKLPQSRQPNIEYDQNSPPYLSVPSSFVKNFDRISGITTHGLFAVNPEQIQDYLSSAKFDKPPITKDLIKLSPILFEIFRISPCDDLYKAVYCSYSLLINTNIQVPLFIRHQAGARLLLLLQIASSPAHYDVIRYNACIFEHKDIDIWRLWLNQLVILSCKKEVKEQLMPLYIEMGYRTLLYAKKMDLKDIEHYLNHRIPPSLVPLETLGNNLDIIFNNPHFENELDKIKSMINKSFPFNFPLYKSQMSIFHLSGDIKLLSDQLVSFTLSTSLSPYTPILIQKCVNPNSSNISSVTKSFFNAIYLMNLIIQSSHSTRIRNMHLSCPFVFEIGDNYLMTLMQGQPFYVKELFEQANEKLKNRTTMKSFFNQNEDEVEFDISKTLVNFIANHHNAYEFVLNRNSILRSFSSHSIVRHIFSIGYQHLEKMILFTNPGAAPLLTIDYENMILRDNLKESSIRYSQIFYELFGGKFGIPVFQVGMAAAASAFVDNLESIRSYLEVLFYDKSFNLNQNEDEYLVDIPGIFEPLFKNRNIIEHRILDLAPPSGIAASADNLIKWMNNMDSLIENAMNEEIQPPLAYPWF